MVNKYRRSQQRWISGLLGLVTALAIGATSLPASAFPWGSILLQGIQLIQLSNVSNSQKVQLGQGIHTQVLSNYRLDSNTQDNAYVNRIGQKMASASDCGNQFPFRFYVVQDASINAFATTGGYVYVNSGLLRAADNEAQVAGVIGHEIGHICNNDLINKMRQSQLAQTAATAVGIDRSTIAALGYQLAVDLPNSRQAEFNADAKGLQYMRRAGYDPQAMPTFLSKLLKYASPPNFLSRHPGTQDRINALQQRIATGR